MNCQRCFTPMHQYDSNIRQLIICCTPYEKICPRCLSDFLYTNQSTVVYICSYCGKNVKAGEFQRKHNLYTSNLDRMMANSRVMVNGFAMAANNNMRQNSFYRNGFDSFRTQNNFNQNQTFQNRYNQPGSNFTGFVRSSFQPQMQQDSFQRNPQIGHIQYNNAPHEMNSCMDMNRVRQINAQPEQLGYLGKIYFNQGMIRPIGNKMNNMSLQQKEEYGERQQQTLSPRFGSRSFKKTCNFQQKPESQIKNVFQPHFGQSNYFSNQSANRKMQLQKHQRSLSSHNRIINPYNQTQRPLSSNSRVQKIEDRSNKSPPSFGKQEF